MNFKAEPSKQAQEVTFLEKFENLTHHKMSFNNNAIAQWVSQNPLGMFLDPKMDVHGHLIKHTQ